MEEAMDLLFQLEGISPLFRRKILMMCTWEIRMGGPFGIIIHAFAYVILLEFYSNITYNSIIAYADLHLLMVSGVFDEKT